ncbi:MAG: hypothetical protein HOQ11_07645 [Gemmatimonadaceae bacterium]|nr:hypothetical protein [Gemmatimonadaceae bacterium]NUR20094.1 hypothetical protein [Gemmatimonadaceae bacterium]NUS97265.1 hypothetical protein [Gemmatimonadaceae bacterium]
MLRTTLACLTLAAIATTVACRGRDAGAGNGPYAREVADAIPRIEAVTKLKFKTPPKVEERSKEQVRAFLEKQFDQQAPAAQMAGEEKALQLLGLIPDTMHLRPFMLDLLTEQIVGYYDPKPKVLYVVKGANQDLVNVTVTHELVHALQDQYVNLDSIQNANDDDSDRKLAAAALIEGHATYEQLQISTGGTFDPDRLGGWAGIRQALRQQQAQLPKFSAAPLYVQETLLFPYLSGAEFVRRALQRDSTASPLARFPESTEQVMFPAAFESNPPDAPTAVTLPAPRGATRVHDDVLGEFGARLFLYEHFRDQAAAIRGAAGWDGDRYMVVHDSRGDGIVWLTVWDTPLDAGEFGDVVKQGIKRRFGGPRETSIPGGSEFAAGARVVRVTGGEMGGRTWVLYVDVPAGSPRDIVDLSAVRLRQP